MAVEEYRSAVGADVSVYVSTDFTTDRRELCEARYLPLDERLMRGLPAYHAAGADGLEFFFFCAMAKTPRREPLFRNYPRSGVGKHSEWKAKDVYRDIRLACCRS